MAAERPWRRVPTARLLIQRTGAVPERRRLGRPRQNGGPGRTADGQRHRRDSRGRPRRTRPGAAGFRVGGIRVVPAEVSLRSCLPCRLRPKRASAGRLPPSPSAGAFAPRGAPVSLVLRCGAPDAALSDTPRRGGADARRASRRRPRGAACLASASARHSALCSDRLRPESTGAAHLLDGLEGLVDPIDQSALVNPSGSFRAGFRVQSRLAGGQGSAPA